MTGGPSVKIRGLVRHAPVLVVTALAVVVAGTVAAGPAAAAATAAASGDLVIADTGHGRIRQVTG